VARRDVDEEQERVHRAIEDALELDDGHVLTGWVLIYETASSDGNALAGHLYGPEGMSTWRALGLTEWVSRYTLHPDDDES
jgi:hypothetical protein